MCVCKLQTFSERLRVPEAVAAGAGTSHHEVPAVGRTPLPAPAPRPRGRARADRRGPGGLGRQETAFRQTVIQEISKRVSSAPTLGLLGGRPEPARGYLSRL